MLDGKAAVKIAREYVSDVYEGKVADIWLEEIVQAGDDTWRITLSFVRRENSPGQTQAEIIQRVLGSPPAFRGERLYKVLEINNESGHVDSMMMRDDVE